MAKETAIEAAELRDVLHAIAHLAGGSGHVEVHDAIERLGRRPEEGETEEAGAEAPAHEQRRGGRA